MKARNKKRTITIECDDEEIAAVRKLRKAFKVRKHRILSECLKRSAFNRCKTALEAV